MKNALAKKSSISLLNNIHLKKKSVYLKTVTKCISKLKMTVNEKQNYKKLSSLAGNKKKGFIVLYSVCFSFSAVNTFLYVTDALGNLKCRYSAGLLSFKGKAKKSRFQILKMFFKELRKLKVSLLKNKPIALNLENVGSYRHLIVRHLKKKFFIRLVNNHQTHPYNGCRKKKKSRK
jgi:ribosomal protein S11